MAKATISNAKSQSRRDFFRPQNARKKRLALACWALRKKTSFILWLALAWWASANNSVFMFYIDHRHSGSHRCQSRAQARISVKSVLSVFEKKNKKQIYPIYLISIPKKCRASISDTSDTSASLITSVSEIICSICVICVQINNHRHSGSHRCQSRAQAR